MFLHGIILFSLCVYPPTNVVTKGQKLANCSTDSWAGAWEIKLCPSYQIIVAAIGKQIIVLSIESLTPGAM